MKNAIELGVVVVLALAAFGLTFSRVSEVIIAAKAELEKMREQVQNVE